MKTIRMLPAAAAALVLAGGAHAAAIAVTSYDMPNGDGQAHGGTYNYWDAGYSGSGATTTDGLSGGALSGGTGKLTDGVIATQPWYEVSDDQGTGQYVGWLQSPTIVFHFAGPATVDTIQLYVDNSHVGGVTAPSAVVVDGTSYANPAWTTASNIETITLGGLDIVGDAVTITLEDPTYWVFLSEVQFSGGASAVPEPAGRATMLAGLAGLAALAALRRRRG
jgi:MYXO-CTERM domain-containing protein